MYDRDFVRVFGKSWINSLSPRYYSILLGTLLLTLFTILYMTNWMEHQKEEIYAQFEEKYKNYIVSFIDEYAKQTSEEEFTTDFIESPGTRLQPIDNTTGSSASTASAADIFGDLPLIEVDDLSVSGFEELGAPIPPTRFYSSPGSNPVPYDQVEMDGLMRDPYAYKIKRTAGMYIEPPDYLLETDDDEIRGYRDPDEIMKALEKRRQLIEICYKKYARSGLAKTGHVEVEFKISPDGYVIAESIRVLNSTINNKAVEQCIKKNIRRLPSFEKKEESQGIAHIVHKFVFN